MVKKVNLWPRVTGVFVALAIFSCNGGSKRGGQTAGTTYEADIEKGVAQLSQGDLVLRRGRDIASYMISRSNRPGHIFSHCGLVQIEGGYPFVYHSISGAGEGRFGLLRDSAAVFFSPAGNSAAAIMRFQLTAEQLERQSEQIKYYYGKVPGFDMDFDLQTSDKLYCTEFVYRVMNAATRDTTLIKAAERNGFRYIPVDNLYADSIAGEIWRITFK